jgi:hypothetical protein
VGECVDQVYVEISRHILGKDANPVIGLLLIVLWDLVDVDIAQHVGRLAVVIHALASIRCGVGNLRGLCGSCEGDRRIDLRRRGAGGRGWADDPRAARAR